MKSALHFISFLSFLNRLLHIARHRRRQ